MNTALATIDNAELETIQRTAAMMLASGFFGTQGGRETGIAQIAVKILAGREMGYGPFASVRGIHVIQGTPAISANLMAAAVKGHSGYDYRVRKMDDAEVAVEFFEIVNAKRESLGVSTFSQADAKRASTKNMDKMPRNMLFARAMSNGVRWFCPDVFSGNAVYVPEELGAEVDGETGEILEGHYTEVKQSTGKAHTPAEPPHAPMVREALGKLEAARTAPSVDVPPLGDLAPLNYNTGNGENAEDANQDDGEPFQPAADAPRFTAPPAAHAWAIENGYCANVHEAQGSFKKIVTTHFGGKLTPDKVADACDLFVARQLEKAAAAAESFDAA